MSGRSVVWVLVILAVCLIVVNIVSRSREDLGQTELTQSESDSLYQAALTLQSKGEVDEAIRLYQDLIEKFPQSERTPEALYKLGELYEKNGLWQQARLKYSKIIADFSDFKQISEVEKKLWDLNIKVLFSPVITEKDIIYKVKPGDTLGKIASTYNTTTELIMRSNNLTSDLIRPGKRLKISNVKYSVIIDKSQNSLTLKADDEIFKVYPVATGEYNSTPSGNFKIVEKLKNPDWYKQGVGIIPADSPENILGSRWLGLSEPQYGIHGGAKPEDLGRQITNGCIRMTDADVEELFTILPRGSEVIIVD